MKAELVIPRVLESLERIAAPYVVVGSLASNVYGVVRSTQDADLVVQMTPDLMSDLIEALGSDFERDPQIEFETITGTLKSTIRERKSSFPIELFQLSDDAHDQERFRRRRKIQILGHDASVLSVEDVLVTKLRWLHLANRTKDRMDIRNVIAVSGNLVDWPYVEKWCDSHGSWPLLDQIRQEMSGT